MRTQARASAVESSLLPGAPRTRLLLWLTAFAVLAAGLLASAGSAQAAPDTYFKVGEFGIKAPGSADGQFNLPLKAAVDDASGNVLVVDSANNRVQVFSPNGGSATFLTKFGEGTLSTPFGIAIDQSSGDVYVSDAGNNRIVRFTSDGAPTPTYTLDPTFTSPGFDAEPTAEPGEIGSFAAPLSVDPTNGDLVVGDPAHKVVDRYESDGTFVSAFDGSTAPSGEPFASVTDVVVTTSGDVVVAQATHVNQFAAGGAHQFDLGPIPQSFAQGTVLSFDPNTGFILVGSGYGGYSEPQVTTAVRAFKDDTLVSTVVLGGGTSEVGIWGITGLAANGGSGPGAGHVYVVGSQVFGCCGVNSIVVFAAGTSPAVALDPPSAVTKTSAHLSGTVNPNGTDTSWRFELSTDGENWRGAPFPDEDAGDGESPVPVSFDVDDLQPNTEYEVRLVAENEAAKRITAVQTFTTPQGEPSVQLLPAAPVGDDTARLNARVNPNGLATTYYFEYGQTDSYGTVVPAGNAGEGSFDVLASADLEGLAAGTTYHFRLVAENSVGTTEGEDLTFTTKTAAQTTLPARGVELVNQPDKGQQNPTGSFLSPVRDRVLWGVFGGAPGSTSGAGATFLADRGAGGWGSFNALPPAKEQAGEGFNHYDILSYTPDLSRFVVSSLQGILTESDSQVLTLDDKGNQNVLWSFPPGQGPMSYDSSDDLAHVVGLVKEEIDPRHGPETSHVYDFGSGTPELLDILPDGSVPACGIPNGTNFAGFGSNAFSPYRWISAKDASQVFFQTQGNECAGAPLEIYVRHRDTETTTWISGPPVSGPDKGAWFIRGNEEGDAAMFVTETRLAAEDTNDTADIYRYRRGLPVECLTCVVSNADVSFDTQLDRQIVVSDDMSRVYFMSDNVLVPGKGKQVNAESRMNLYVWHEGEIDYVSPASFGSLNGGTYSTTSDGSVLYFRAGVPGITADDNGGTLQYYRYDARDGALECISCKHDGSPSIDENPQGPSYRGSTPMVADGSAYVFQSTEKLVPEDINGTWDIYEWRDGVTGLITDGETVWREGPGQLALQGISRNGANVLFSGGARLTGWETDQVAQLYVARIGGGFPPPPPPPPRCSEDSCQGPLGAAPAAVAPVSGSYSGPGNKTSKAKQKQKAKKCPKGKVRKGKKCVKKAKKKPARQGRKGGK